MKALAAGLVMLIVGLPSAVGAPTRTKVDRAVDRGLAFLQKEQNVDGSWVSHRKKSPAVTALAVMAFLSAGHVPGEGPYANTIDRGIRWVLRSQQRNGLIATTGHGEMYHHGICTLMLAEVVGMTDERLAKVIRQRLERAVLFILNAQRQSGKNRGAWRYRFKGTDGDVSVTGWQVMALRAAKNVGCDIPAARIQMAVDYIRRCRDPVTGGFRYYPGSRITSGLTATGILTLELCGKNFHHGREVLKAGANLLQNLPRWDTSNFFYDVYYGSQAMFQLGGNYWNVYRARLHQVLIQNQGRTGSWKGKNNIARIYGSSYSTSMALLALTVEYRFLPIYQRAAE